jgi:hypothetical protein
MRRAAGTCLDMNGSTARAGRPPMRFNGYMPHVYMLHVRDAMACSSAETYAWLTKTIGKPDSLDR